MTGVVTPPLASPARAIAAALAALTAATLPVFLTGALQGRIAADLDIGTGAIGTAIAAFFLAGAVTSIPGGRLVDRLGAPLALRLGMLIVATAAVAIALGAHDRWRLTLGLALAGTSLAFVDPGGARALTSAVPRERHGVAFGAKEASVPFASLLAGLVLPLLGAHLGWRPAFLLGAGIAVATAIVVPAGLDPSVSGLRRRPQPSSASSSAPRAETTTSRSPSADATSPPTRPDRRPPPRTGLLLAALAISSALGGGIAAAVAAFLVPTAQVVGLTAGAAGVLLSVGSMGSVVVRLASGMLVDRRPGSELRWIARLTAIGAAGIAVLAVLSAGGDTLVGVAPSALTVTVLGLAAIAALGAGWGWTGLTFLAAVRLEPQRPARAAGTVLSGLAVGGSLGPALLGTLAEVTSFAATWGLAAAAMALAAVGVLSLRRAMPTA